MAPLFTGLSALANWLRFITDLGDPDYSHNQRLLDVNCRVLLRYDTEGELGLTWRE